MALTMRKVKKFILLLKNPDRISCSAKQDESRKKERERESLKKFLAGKILKSSKFADNNFEYNFYSGKFLPDV